MESQTRPKYNEFLKQWSKDHNMSSFFGSDKADFLRDWSNVKTGGKTEKPVLQPPVIETPKPEPILVVKRSAAPRKKAVPKETPNKVLTTCDRCGMDFNTKRDFWIESSKGDYCSLGCAIGAKVDFKNKNTVKHNEFSKTFRGGELRNL